jgi:hypothetical protein
MENFFGVLTSPKAAFERLREKGGWVITLLVLTAISLISVWLQSDAILGTVELEFDRQAQLGQDIPEDVRDIAIASAGLFSYVTGAISVVLTMFVGGLLLLLVNLIVRGEATYMQLSKVALFSYIPVAISALLTGIISFATGATTVYDVMLNAGAFVEDKSSMLFVLASMINPFSIWSLLLLIIGTEVMTRKSRGSVATWIVIGWLIITFLTALSAKMSA